LIRTVVGTKGPRLDTETGRDSGLKKIKRLLIEVAVMIVDVDKRNGRGIALFTTLHLVCTYTKEEEAREQNSRGEHYLDDSQNNVCTSFLTRREETERK
jgi:hypothetical protein